MECAKAWDIFLAQMPLIERGELPNDDAYAEATGHMDNCAACLEGWKRYKETAKPSPAPAPAPTPKPAVVDPILSHVLESAGLSLNASPDTLLDSLALARVFISWAKRHRNRRLRLRSCFPDRMTARRAAAICRRSRVLIPRSDPALAQLEADRDQDRW